MDGGDFFKMVWTVKILGKVVGGKMKMVGGKMKMVKEGQNRVKW